MAASAFAAFAVALVIPSGVAAAPGYCSPTGDFCFTARRLAGRVALDFNTFSFTGRVRTCVRPPRRQPERCRAFRLRKRPMGVYGFRALWSAHFPRHGAGTYQVRFLYQGTALGPPVTFRIRA